MEQEHRESVSLSPKALSIWGKSDRGEDKYWLPLYVHMYDSMSVADLLWENWVPQGTRNIIIRGIGGYEQLARIAYRFLAGVHDIGKATPVFQAQTWGFGAPDAQGLVWKPLDAGLKIKSSLRKHLAGTFRVTHPLAGQVILDRYLNAEFSWPRKTLNSYSCIVGGHHGNPPSCGDLIRVRDEYPASLGWDCLSDDSWMNTQKELIDFLAKCSGFTGDIAHRLMKYYIPPMAESILTGLVIMADWIASNTDYFPLLPLFPETDDQRIDVAGCINMRSLEERAQKGWNELHLTSYWQPSQGSIPSSVDDLYTERFSFPQHSLRPVQLQAAQLALNNPDPGLMVIEAPMGEGKTEAALAAAEILARSSGRGGVCIALPTMATTDAMFGRVHRWLKALPQDAVTGEKSVYLAHGKAQLNDEFQGIMLGKEWGSASEVGMDLDDSEHSLHNGISEETTVVNEWMKGRKKGVLANFLVCTVDQVLMGALDMKHLALRQLALANKVVIIDECHAYDVYMQQYLLRVLEWLGAMGAPVILLSATLPEGLRQQMVDAYVQGKQTMVGTPKIYSEAPIRREYKRRPYKTAEDSAQESCVNKEADAPVPAAVHEAYPLITYTTGTDTASTPVKPSGRSSHVHVSLIADDDDSLVTLLKDALVGGGCAGVICDTVARAQHAYEVLGAAFGSDVVKLNHARFIDLDRMQNETGLRSLLGPEATRANGKRPELSIVIGTQVLEQSLDIDFDILVSDIAPVDLVMQRLGRLHRHHRGEGESDRPCKVRLPACYLRGIESWDGGVPKIAGDIEKVYFSATLLESLSVMGLTDDQSSAHVHLPQDIASLVRQAYDTSIQTKIPRRWFEEYQKVTKERENGITDKEKRADTYLLRSVKDMCDNNNSLVDWFEGCISDTSRDEDKGQRAVRDTQESVEVLLLVRDNETIDLLPWVQEEYAKYIGDEKLSTACEPEEGLSKVMAQCVVRLPMSMTPSYDVDALISDLEEECGEAVSMWQNSAWLKGTLVLFLSPADDNKTFNIDIHGFAVSYSRNAGLSVVRKEI